MEPMDEHLGALGTYEDVGLPPLTGLSYIMSASLNSTPIRSGTPRCLNILIPPTSPPLLCIPSTNDRCLDHGEARENEDVREKLDNIEDEFMLKLSDEVEQYAKENLGKGTKNSNITAMNEFTRFSLDLMNKDEAKHERLLCYVSQYMSSERSYEDQIHLLQKLVFLDAKPSGTLQPAEKDRLVYFVCEFVVKYNPLKKREVAVESSRKMMVLFIQALCAVTCTGYKGFFGRKWEYQIYISFKLLS